MSDANSFTDDELEMMAHGNNPQSNAYRELLAFRQSANSPVIPDSWVACKDRMPREGDYVIVAPDGGVTQCVTYFWEDCPINGKPMWFTHSEECEPVSLAEFTHWQPLPAAPKPEK